jgi:hypothetical protein
MLKAHKYGLYKLHVHVGHLLEIRDSNKFRVILGFKVLRIQYIIYHINSVLKLLKQPVLRICNLRHCNNYKLLKNTWSTGSCGPASCTAGVFSMSCKHQTVAC